MLEVDARVVVFAVADGTEPGEEDRGGIEEIAVTFVGDLLDFRQVALERGVVRTAGKFLDASQRIGLLRRFRVLCLFCFKFGLLLFKEGAVIVLDLLLFVAQTAYLRVERLFVSGSEVGQSFVYGQRDAVAAPAAVGQGVEVGQGGPGLRADVARADFGTLVVLFDQLLCDL